MQRTPSLLLYADSSTVLADKAGGGLWINAGKLCQARPEMWCLKNGQPWRCHEVAVAELAIRHDTVRAHLHSIFSNTGVRHQTERVRIMLNGVSALGQPQAG